MLNKIIVSGFVLVAAIGPPASRLTARAASGYTVSTIDVPGSSLTVA